jgi:hypothetical protein
LLQAAGSSARGLSADLALSGSRVVALVPPGACCGAREIGRGALRGGSGATCGGRFTSATSASDSSDGIWGVAPVSVALALAFALAFALVPGVGEGGAGDGDDGGEGAGVVLLVDGGVDRATSPGWSLFHCSTSSRFEDLVLSLTTRLPSLVAVAFPPRPRFMPRILARNSSHYP